MYRPASEDVFSVQLCSPFPLHEAPVLSSPDDGRNVVVRNSDAKTSCFVLFCFLFFKIIPVFIDVIHARR